MTIFIIPVNTLACKNKSASDCNLRRPNYSHITREGPLLRATAFHHRLTHLITFPNPILFCCSLNTHTHTHNNQPATRMCVCVERSLGLRLLCKRVVSVAADRGGGPLHKSQGSEVVDRETRRGSEH